MSDALDLLEPATRPVCCACVTGDRPGMKRPFRAGPVPFPSRSQPNTPPAHCRCVSRLTPVYIERQLFDRISGVAVSQVSALASIPGCARRRTAVTAVLRSIRLPLPHTRVSGLCALCIQQHRTSAHRFASSRSCSQCFRTTHTYSLRSLSSARPAAPMVSRYPHCHHSRTRGRTLAVQEPPAHQCDLLISLLSCLCTFDPRTVARLRPWLRLLCWPAS
jgi:hypothetical protein